MLVMAFVVGTVLGSFATVLGPRARKRQWPTGRSVCLTCGTQIRAFDNIPIVGFLMLRGRCRNCRTPYGWHYLYIEVIGGLALTLAVSLLPSPLTWAIAALTLTLFLSLSAALLEPRVLNHHERFMS